MVQEIDGIDLDSESVRLLLKSVRGYATSWNPGAQNIKGYAPEAVLGKHFSTFYTPEDRAAGEPERELISATSGVYSAEVWRVRKNGERFWASVTLTALFDDSGDLRGFAKVTRDMTEYRRAQEERIRLERAEEALRLRDEFVREARAGLNAVLVPIRIHLQSLTSAIGSVSDETSATLRAKLTTLEWSLDRLSNKVDDVLQTVVGTGSKLAQQERHPGLNGRRSTRSLPQDHFTLLRW